MRVSSAKGSDVLGTIRSYLTSVAVDWRRLLNELKTVPSRTARKKPHQVRRQDVFNESWIGLVH